MATPTISIWRLSPETLKAIATLPADACAALRNSFSPEENHRAQAFYQEEDRLLYTASHAALRTVLGRLAGTLPVQLEIAAEAGVKPTLRHTDPQIHFNLAHTRGAVLIATTEACEIGIDIEHHRPLDDLESLAEAIMSPTERATWTTLAPSTRQTAFYRLWTRKEAYLKAIGLGLFRELQAVIVPTTPVDLPTPAPVEDQTDPGANWLLQDLQAWPGFSAALCWPAKVPQPSLQIRELTLRHLTHRTP